MKFIRKAVWEFVSTALLTIFAIWFLAYLISLLT